MEHGNNFASAWKKYLESRKIKENSIKTLEQKGLIKYDQDFIAFYMKDLDGNIVWEQQRSINEQKSKLKPKSKSKSWSKVWYFYTTIDWSKPIIIVEGEIDWASVLDLPNVIGLQWIANLKKLIVELKEKWVSEIYILVDKDHSADNSIGRILDMDQTFLENVFDCRGILCDQKDINDHICWWWEITLNGIFDHKKSLWEFKKFIDSFLVGENKTKVNHNEFAKYLIWKYNISSSNENLFVYNYWLNKWIWRPLDKQSIKQIIIKEMESWLSHAISHYKTNDLSSVLEFVIAHSKDYELENSLLYQNENDICLEDWILEIDSMNLREYASIDYKFQKLSYSINVFDKYSEPKKFLEFLKEILEWYENIDQIILFLQEFIGWLLITSTKFQKALLIHWTWANGKGVLLNIIKELLWSSNCSNIWLHEINKDQYLYNLIGKTVNIDSDMQQNVQLDSWIIKKLVSWESISAKTLYKQPIEFTPYIRLLIATNELPYLKTIDNSIRRRFIFLHLKQSFYWRENPNLVKEILEEKESIFVWSIRGLERLIARDDFDIPKELETELDNFIKENDTVEQFFEEWIVEVNSEAKISWWDLYMLYKSFCNDYSYKPFSQRRFSSKIRERWFQDYRDSNSRWFIWLEKNNPF